MTIFKKPQNPSEGIRLAFYGVLLSIIFGIGSMVYYNVAKDLYQSRIEQAGQNMTKEFMATGREYSSKLSDIGTDASNDLATGNFDMSSYSDRGDDALGTAMAQGQQTMANGAASVSEAQEKLMRDFTISKVLNYLAFLIAMVACVYGMVQVNKLKKTSGEPVAGASSINWTFILFAVAALVSLSSPVGISCRVSIGNDTGERIALLTTILSVVLFIPGLILWFVGKKELNGPRARTVAAPVASPVAVAAETPVSAPASPNQFRTLTIVIAVAAAIIIGLLCAILIRTANNQSSAQKQSLPEVAVSEALVEDEVVEEIPKIVESTPTTDYPRSGEYELHGTIAGKNVEVWFDVNTYGNLTGAYKYTANNSSENLRLSGSFDFPDTLVVDEYYDDEQTGLWKLKFTSSNTLEGTIINTKGNEYPIHLVVISYNSYEE